MLDGIPTIPYIRVAMRFYYRAYGFTYRYFFRSSGVADGVGFMRK